MPSSQDPFAAPSEGSPVPPPPPYGQPPGSPPPYGTLPAGMRNGVGTAALVLGILALLGAITVVGGVLFGVIAIVLGVIGRGRVGRHEASNGGSATAGLVCGVLGLVLSAALVAAGIGFIQSDRGKQLRSCLDSAGSDSAAQQKCRVEFTDTFRR